ncbi:MAG: VWA domain-containing protein [Gammaproteobacteria bacterium]
MDAVLIIDSSGSMAKNDPDKLRVPAAKMFMSLLAKEDRVGLISFSDNGYPVLRLTHPSAKTNRRILASADKVSSKGVYTNLHAALVKGMAMLDKQQLPDRDKMLVLMSDGKMDVGSKKKDNRLREAIYADLISQLKEKNIKVYTVAFTQSSDVDLMEDLSEQSGGLYQLAETHQDLHSVFSSIFQQSKSPDMLPIEGGEFTVDDAIEEVTLVASKDNAKVRILLQTPSGKKISAKNKPKNVTWFESHHFDMVTVTAPTPGIWRLLSTSGNNHAYIVTNMSLENNLQETRIPTNKDIIIASWLEENGELVNREAVLANTEFYMRIIDPDKAEVAFDLFDNGQYGDQQVSDGKYSNTLAFEYPGAYTVHLIAKGSTFQREKTVILNVIEPAGEQVPEPEEEPKPAIDKTVPPKLESKPEPMPELVLEQKPEMEKNTQPEVEPEPKAEPESEPETEESGASMVMVGAVFVGINTLLGLVGGGVWWFLKRKKKSGDDDETDDDEAES